MQILTEASNAGYSIEFSDSVKTKSELTGDNDNTFELVRNITERKNNFGIGKDLKKQLINTAIPDEIAQSVGENGVNTTEDVTAIQNLLVNANYDVEINGVFDEKTKKAIEQFMKAIYGKTYKTIDPYGKTMRYLRAYKYKIPTTGSSSSTSD